MLMSAGRSKGYCEDCNSLSIPGNPAGVVIFSRIGK